MNELGVESKESVIQDIRELHSFHWPRLWRGIDVGYFAESFQKISKGFVNWDVLFYLLDGGIGFSITGSNWFQKLVAINEHLEVKALAVATRAYAILNDILPDEYPKEIIDKLCSIIWKQRTKVSKNPSWSSGFKWRTSTGHTIEKDESSSLVTALVGLAYLDAYRVCGDIKYKERANKIGEYFVHENGYEIYPDRTICFYYTPKMREPITNASAFTALFLKSLSIITKQNDAARLSERAFSFIINNQQNDGSWFYFPDSQWKTNIIDNYHTGFVLEALLEGLNMQYNREMDLCLKRGLRFYASFFKKSGQPKFNVRKEYPIDIHDAAQGIVVYSLAQRTYNSGGQIADQIRKFVNIHMKRRNKRYISRIYRLGKSNLITPRWADCWMFLGLAEFLRSLTQTVR